MRASPSVTTRDDFRYMARALRLAERGLYSTMPNPRVGCVLVRDAGIIGEGWHAFAGGPHAEVDALSRAQGKTRGATAYVTLEPCCHHGRTPPCADALIAAGVARVVVAMADPNPAVAGAGIVRLEKAGIDVTQGVLERQAAALNPGFIRRMRHDRPYVRCKLAMSLDGRTATATGESQWITSPAARRDVQRLRARSCVIMTGIGTVLHDDPRLTVRWDEIDAIDGFSDAARISARQPLRVIVDSRLRTPPTARLLGLPGKTLIATAVEAGERAAALAKAGVQTACFPGRDGRVDLAGVLRYLGADGVNEVLLEAGAELAGAMVANGLIDEFVFYLSPQLMGDGARGLFRLPGLQAMSDNIRLAIREVRAVGTDWRITAVPAGAD